MEKVPIALMMVESIHCRIPDQSDHAVFVVQNDLEAKPVPKIEKI